MLSDVLHDALLEIERYQREMADIYGRLSHRIKPVKDAMTALQQYLDTYLPEATPIVPHETFTGELLAKWYESAPYGEQTPRDLPQLLVRFANAHGLLNVDGMEDLLSEAPEDDPVWQLFACIFTTAARFTIDQLDNAMVDRDPGKLKAFGLQLVGVLSTAATDPHPACPSQHIMHPNYEGIALFREITR